MVNEDGLQIPESNREIAIHLKNINLRLDNFERTVSTVQDEMERRRIASQNLLLGNLLLPLVGGMLLFLLTKAFG